MNYSYGQPLSLKKDIKLKFYVDAVYPSGQLGYSEPHYKVMFDEANLIIAESLLDVLFEPKKLNDTAPTDTQNLSKLNKDDLIGLAVQIDSSSDLTKLKKAELIEIIEESK